MLKLYELCAADTSVRFSPPCWLAKFALLHKGAPFDTVPLGFAEKQNYPDPDYGLLPMLDDDGILIRDSAAIAGHLDKKSPERPLFDSEGERAAHAVYKNFLGAYVFPALGPQMFWRVAKILNADDAAHFRDKRERRMGKTLEAAADDESLRPRLETAMTVLAAPLETHSYFGGRAPDLNDYLIAGVFMWQRCVTAETLYETPAPLAAWFERILDLYDGYARKAPRAE